MFRSIVSFVVDTLMKAAILLAIIGIIGGLSFKQVYSGQPLSLRLFNWELSPFDGQHIWQTRAAGGDVRIFYRDYFGISAGSNWCLPVPVVRFCYEHSEDVASTEQVNEWISKFGEPPQVEKPPEPLRGVSVFYAAGTLLACRK